MGKILEFGKQKEVFSWAATPISLPKDKIGRQKCAEIIGVTLAMARKTDTAMLCTDVDSGGRDYWLLLGFLSSETMHEFMDILRRDDRTEILYAQMSAALNSDVRRAQPLDELLPQDVLRNVIWTAALTPSELYAVNGTENFNS